MNTPTKPILKDILEGPVQYRVPMYQRPYVWDREDQWEPLWEDIQAVADQCLEGVRTNEVRKHFLGAIVLKTEPPSPGEATIHEIVDGQQRLATLILFLRAFRCVLLTRSDVNTRYAEDIGDLLINEKYRSRGEIEQWKLLPSRSDQDDYFAVMRADSVPDLRKQLRMSARSLWSGRRIADAFLYFHAQLETWLLEGPKSPEERAKALHAAVSIGLQMVAICLDHNDDAQLIFETLNARGTPLLQGDLVKNYVLRTLEEGEDRDALLEAGVLFRELDDDGKFWRSDMRQGRLFRPTVDIFLFHFLTMNSVEIVPSGGLFDCFRQMFDTNRLHSISFIRAMRSYARVYKNLVHPEQEVHAEIRQFLNRLTALDTGTVFPLLMSLRAKLVDDLSFVQAARLLESYLVRRVVCGLSPKNYNKFFHGMTKHIASAEEVSACLREQLLAGQDETTRWPDDLEFRRGFLRQDVYHFMSRQRLRMILLALDGVITSKKSEAQVVEEGRLTIEHLLPQKWLEKWSLPDDSTEALDRREALLHSIGNLTLLTTSLNPSISNDAWSVKLPELKRHTALAMNRLIVENDVWNEDLIVRRGDFLAGKAIDVWRR